MPNAKIAAASSEALNNSAFNRLKMHISSERTIVSLLFVMSVIARVWMFLSAVDKNAFYTSTDEEQIIFCAASNLRFGKGLSMYGRPAAMGGALYSVLLSLLFFLPDIYEKTGLFIVFNAVLLSAGVFPVHYIASRLLDKRSFRILSCLIYLFFPFHFYSVKILSVDLFIPLALTLTCLFYRVIAERGTLPPRKNIIFCLIAGAVSYFLYITDESALLIPAVFILCLLISGRRDPGAVSFKGMVKTQALPYITGYIVPFILIGCIMSVNGISSSADAEAGSLETIAYLFIYIVMAAVIYMYAAPFLLPVIYFDKLSGNAKKLFVVTSGMLASVAFSAAVKTSGGISEKDLPVTDLRYICWAFILFIIIMLQLMEKSFASERGEFSGRLRYIVPFLMLLPLFPGFAQKNINDHSPLVFDGLSAVRLLAYMLGTAVICILAALALSERRRSLALIYIIALLSFDLNETMNMYNDQKSSRMINAAAAESAQAISEFAKEHMDDTYLILTDPESPSYEKTLTTYLHCPDIRAANKEEFKECADEDKKIILSKAKINSMNGESYDEASYDHIIAVGDIAFDENENCVRDSDISSGYFSVFHISDSDKPVYIKTEWNRIVDFNEYFSTYDRCRENYLMIVSVCDEASTAIDDEKAALLSRIGMGDVDGLTVFRSGYICVMEKGVCKYSAASTTDMLEYEFDINENKSVSVKSGGYSAGGSSSIMINGTEYSLGERGMNIVLYDLSSDNVVDSLCIDTYISANSFIRK